MNCLEFRRAVASNPHDDNPELAAKARECPNCARYLAEVRALDEGLAAAFAVPAPERSVADYLTAKPAEATPAAVEEPAPRRWYALAASVVAGLGLAIGWRLFTAAPNTLHEAVIAHVHHEPELLALPEGTRAAPYQVATVLERSEVSLNGDIGEVAHAGLCLFRGNLVPHLVVSTEVGSVTVLLPNEELGEATPINEEGFVGTIVPVGKGSIAIIGDDAETARSVENRIVQAVDWGA